jgi:hypothetical protein
MAGEQVGSAAQRMVFGVRLATFGNLLLARHTRGDKTKLINSA